MSFFGFALKFYLMSLQVLFRGVGGSEAMCWQTWRWWGGVWVLWQYADTAVIREESCERVGAWSKLKSRVISMRSQPNCLLLSLSLLMLFLLLLLFLNVYIFKDIAQLGGREVKDSGSFCLYPQKVIGIIKNVRGNVPKKWKVSKPKISLFLSKILGEGAHWALTLYLTS